MGNDTKDHLCVFLLCAMAPLFFLIVFNSTAPIETFRVLICVSAVFWFLILSVMHRNGYTGSVITKIVITLIMTALLYAVFFSLTFFYTTHLILTIVLLINFILYLLEFMSLPQIKKPTEKQIKIWSKYAIVCLVSFITLLIFIILSGTLSEFINEAGDFLGFIIVIMASSFLLTFNIIDLKNKKYLKYWITYLILSSILIFILVLMHSQYIIFYCTVLFLVVPMVICLIIEHLGLNK